jgi:hypothetical protein
VHEKVAYDAPEVILSRVEALNEEIGGKVKALRGVLA